MINFKVRILSIFVCTALLCICCCDSVKADGYPTHWDLTQIYPSAEVWYSDYNEVETLIAGHAEYRGRLNNVDTIWEYFDRFYMGTLTEKQSRLYMYAMLGYNLDPSNAEYLNMLTLINQQTAREYEVSAFVEPEILSLPYADRLEIFGDPRFDEIRYSFREYLVEEPKLHSEETSAAMALLSPALGWAQTIYEILTNVDMPLPTIRLDDGTLIEMTDDVFVDLVYYNDDADLAVQAIEAFVGVYRPYVNTLAALLDSAISETVVLTNIDGYASSLDAALDSEGVDKAIYDNVIATARAGIGDYQRFLNIHKYALGLDEQLAIDISSPTSNYSPAYISYDAAVDTVIDALGILGDEYTAVFKKLVSAGCIDVYPAANKVGGGFTSALSGTTLPFVLLNYDGSVDSVSTLAHEMGHAMYYELCSESQPLLNRDPTVFTQEVASVTNELLYYTYMRSRAANADEELYWIEQELILFSTTFFLQAMYAEFEDWLYKTVESGYALNAEELSDKWEELLNEYRGDSVTLLNNSRYGWAGIAHFYYNYYVYKYASSMCYAASICNTLLSEGEPAVNAYIDFLRAGGSDSPANLLAIAGIDVMDEDTYSSALEYYSNLVDEYAALTGYQD